MAGGDFERHIATHALTHDERLGDLLLGAQANEIVGEAVNRIPLLRLVALTMPMQMPTLAAT